MTNRAALLLALSLPTTAYAAGPDWQIDPSHSAAQFSVKHMMVSTVRGDFQKLSGTVALDDKDLKKSVVNVEIDVDSIDTREPKRDGHLRSPDFFDAAKFPKITFKSTRVEQAGVGKYSVTGDLTMHGQTHPVTLTVDGPSAPAKSPFGTTVRGVSATGKLSRKAWGLVWNKAIEAGGVMVGDEITLQIDAELVAK